MSRFKSKKVAPGLAGARSNIGSMLKSQGTELTNASIAGGMISLESSSPDMLDNIQHSFESMEVALKGQFIEAFGDNFVMSDVGLEAATIVALGMGNPTAFAQQALQTVGLEGAIEPISVGLAGSLDFRMTPSSEAFDEASLNLYAPVSIVYNALSAQQDEFGEAFFPTYVMSADQTGLTVSVQRTMVFNEVRRDAKGNATDFNKVNLVDALQDASILENNTTKVVPIYLADDSRAEFFLDTDLLAPRDIELDGVAQKTSALAVNVTMDVLALSVGTGGVNSQLLDSTDALDARIGLSNLYLRLRNAANVADSATGEVNIVKVPVEGLPRANFNASAEGEHREMTLNFRNNTLVLDGDVKDVEGNDASVLAALKTAGSSALLTVGVTGTVNVETASLEVNANAVKINKLISAEGESIPVSSGAGRTVVSEIIVDVVGYELSAYKSNANRRTRGLLIDRTEINENYTIPLGAPISAPAPAHNATDSASDLRALITTSRTRTANNAVTTLLNYAASLKATVRRQDKSGFTPSVAGIARYLVKPFFLEIEIDAETEILNARSNETARDVAALLIDAIRDVAYRMNRDSNYQSALDMETAGTQTKPKLIIGTDSVLARHIMVEGDERTASIGMDFQVVTSPDSRMTDKIVLTFSRGGQGKPDALSFGTHAYMPELTSAVTVSRDNATTKETQVQPRDLHIPHLPIMAVINVKNLDKVLRTRK